MTSPYSRDGDTIAAIATAPGRGGVGIVRVSGKQAKSIGSQVTRQDLRPRYAHYSKFSDGQNNTLDSGIALFFPAPHSFTGEDVVELQAHGGPIVLDLLLRECCQLGARPAGPGEFTERAYLNDKIDLAQAEAIADLINSSTEKAALNAAQSLQGAFSKKIDTLVASVVDLRVYVEAAIDFPEEEIDFIQDGQVGQRLQIIIDQLEAVRREAKQGRLMQEGMKLVIAGKPNAGKSSLLNALSGQDSAIVTDIAGTTRDVLREHIQIDGMPLHIVDTAGLRESGDAVEMEGIRRAWAEIESADHILLVIDGSASNVAADSFEFAWPNGSKRPIEHIPLTIILNKSDLTQPVTESDNDRENPVIRLSAKTGQGIDLLRQHLKVSMGYEEQGEGLFSARRRHLQSLQTALDYLLTGQHQLLQAGAGELLAEDLRQCQNSLGEITGAMTSDELLGEIFSGFCIGK